MLEDERGSTHVCGCLSLYRTQLNAAQVVFHYRRKMSLLCISDKVLTKESRWHNICFCT